MDHPKDQSLFGLGLPGYIYIIIYIYIYLNHSQPTSSVIKVPLHYAGPVLLSRHEQKIRKLDLAKTVAEEKEKQLREAARSAKTGVDWKGTQVAV